MPPLSVGRVDRRNAAALQIELAAARDRTGEGYGIATIDEEKAVVDDAAGGDRARRRSASVAGAELELVAAIDGDRPGRGIRAGQRRMAGDREDDRPRDCPGEGGTVDGIVISVAAPPLSETVPAPCRSAMVIEKPPRSSLAPLATVVTSDALASNRSPKFPSPAFNAPALTLTLAPLFALPEGESQTTVPFSPASPKSSATPETRSSRRGSAWSGSCRSPQRS